MKWPSVSSLRVRLLLFVLLALIPARGLGIYTAWEMRQDARTEALRDAMRLARLASTAGERLIEGTHQILAESRLPKESTVTVVDGAGQVLARDPEPERWVGKSFPDAPFVGAAISQQDEGTVEGSGLDGTPRLYAFTPLRAGEQERFAHVYIGIPRDSAFARVNQIDTRSLAGFGGVLLFALLATAIGSRVFILRPVTALVQTMRRLGAGDLAARTGLPHTPSEFGRLAAALDEMAERLEKQQAGGTPG